MQTEPTTLYSKAVQISEEYLGPAGERFIRRQISTHLGIKPEELSRRHVPNLVNWAGIAFALLTKDTKDIQGFRQGLLALSSDSE